jgi:hypothetical protein
MAERILDGRGAMFWCGEEGRLWAWRRIGVQFEATSATIQRCGQPELSCVTHLHHRLLQELANREGQSLVGGRSNIPRLLGLVSVCGI